MGCGSCHRLAGTNGFGDAAPPLSGLRLRPGAVAKIVREGGKQMPAYRNQLSAGETRLLARFVARASR